MEMAIQPNCIHRSVVSDRAHEPKARAHRTSGERGGLSTDIDCATGLAYNLHSRPHLIVEYQRLMARSAHSAPGHHSALVQAGQRFKPPPLAPKPTAQKAVFHISSHRFSKVSFCSCSHGEAGGATCQNHFD